MRQKTLLEEDQKSEVTSEWFFLLTQAAHPKSRQSSRMTVSYLPRRHFGGAGTHGTDLPVSPASYPGSEWARANHTVLANRALGFSISA